jgi:hypothetical protein
MEQLSSSLIVACLFDRETNVRRAAAAALQENVGRLGTVPHGIAVIAEADFFAVGNRSHAYTRIASFVAQFAVYQPTLVTHLATVKIFHWDEAVRRETAEALCCLAQACPELVEAGTVQHLLPEVFSLDLNRRHGAVLGLGKAVLGLAHHLHGAGASPDSAAAGNMVPAYCPTPEITAVLLDLVGAMQARGYLRGIGGIYLRQALCSCLVALAAAGFVVSTPEAENGSGASMLMLLQAWFGFVEENLVHSDEAVQVCVGE